MIHYLNKLGLTKDWINYGILSSTELEKLYLNYLESNDKNIEHYRYALLKKWILDKKSFSRDKWNIFYSHIFPKDGDRPMIESVLISLVKQDFLDDSDLEMILSDSHGNIHQEVKRKILLNKIENQK